MIHYKKSEDTFYSKWLQSRKWIQGTLWRNGNVSDYFKYTYLDFNTVEIQWTSVQPSNRKSMVLVSTAAKAVFFDRVTGGTYVIKDWELLP